MTSYKAKPKHDGHDQERIDAAIAKRERKKAKRLLIVAAQRKVSP